MKHKDFSYPKKGKEKRFTLSTETLRAWETSQDGWCFKNKQKNIIYVNDAYRKILHQTRECKESFLSHFHQPINMHDDKVMFEKRKVSAVGMLPQLTDSDLSVFDCERSPFYDLSGEMVGIVSHIKPLDCITPRYFFFGDGAGPLNISCPLDTLTDKEWVIAFLVIWGLSEKEISEKIHRTLRTIKFHKNNIFNKTLCVTTRDFVEMARKNRWHLYIPPVFASPCYIVR